MAPPSGLVGVPAGARARRVATGSPSVRVAARGGRVEVGGELLGLGAQLVGGGLLLAGAGGPLAGLLLGQRRPLLDLGALPPGAGGLLLGERLLLLGPGAADLRLLQVLARLLPLADLRDAGALGMRQREQRSSTTTRRRRSGR